MNRVGVRPLFVGWRAEIMVGGFVVLGAAALAANSSSANAENRVRKDRRVVESAAEQLTYQAISDAWVQYNAANPAPLETLKSAVPLRWVGANEQAGSVVVLTFGAHRATCIDLISSPFANTVRTRPGC
jgi:hypothetical protein